ncbi:MAG: GAF domain-containing sensor histidine kinase [Chloroflexi bacterium]|nr:GAF domain-containing sensor histidine kinase [Chloroflexota bacterium]
MPQMGWQSLSGLLLLGSAAGIALAIYLPAFALPLFVLTLSLSAIFFAMHARLAQPARVQDYRALIQSGLDLASAQNYGAALRAVVDHARELVRGDASALCLGDEQNRAWVVQGASGATDAFQINVKPFVRAGAPPQCPVVRFNYRAAHLDAPIVRDGRVIGCLCIANKNPRDFSAREHELLQGVAAQASRALERAREFEMEGARAARAERERLAREMHDTLAQLLSFVSFKTQSAREYLAQGKLADAQTQLDQLTFIAQQLYADTREVILGLKTEITPARGLVPALRVYAEWFSELSGIVTQIDAGDLEATRFSIAVEAQLIRVVQEALSNVRKHARAQHACVTFARDGATARITIQDDGVGFHPAHIARGPLPRFGLNSMRERVESIGGKFSIQSEQDKGTRVEISLPLVYRAGE